MSTVMRKLELSFGVGNVEPTIDMEALKCYANIKKLTKCNNDFLFFTGSSIALADGVIHITQGDQFGNMVIIYILATPQAVSISQISLLCVQADAFQRWFYPCDGAEVAVPLSTAEWVVVNDVQEFFGNIMETAQESAISSEQGQFRRVSAAIM